MSKDERYHMKSIELFSGTGGLALGLHQAGFSHEALFEWDKDSCDNIKHNIANGYPGVKDWSVFQTDVRTVSYDDYTGRIQLVLKSLLKPTMITRWRDCGTP